VTDIYIQSGTVKVNGVAVTEMGYMVKPGDVVNFDEQH
jgi:23S rRNA pseudouridine2605 synthase